MLKVIFISTLIFLLSGCSAPQPPVTEFRINSKVISGDFSSKGCLQTSIKVAQAFSSNTLMSKDMNYAQGSHKQFSFSQSQWADTPNRAVSSEIAKLLRDIKLFESVLVSKSRSRSSWLLETNIEEFMQYFNEDSTKSHANVVVSLTIVDTGTGKVVATKTFSSIVDTKSLDADGGVEALNRALLDVLQQSSEWFGGVCK